MRESGFDVSFRFGPFGAGTHHYTPVCLNSLLYKSEMDLAHISAVLGRESESRRWRQRALDRRRAIQRYLWDETRGLFLDYNFETRRRSRYEFATTFYPLWVGLASRRQARAIVGNLKLFEQPGGLATSRRETQAQWDYPYGWAPIHLIATEGLRRYGYRAEADRIAYDFLSMVVENFRREHTLREKYNVVKRSSETQVEAGYQENVVGFGWTNGVFLELLHGLPKAWAVRVTN
jgi:alpha,alpha-trehalase